MKPSCTAPPCADAKARVGRKKYMVALCTIEVSDKKSKNYKIVDAYNEWFHNK